MCLAYENWMKFKREQKILLALEATSRLKKAIARANNRIEILWQYFYLKIIKYLIV